MVLDQIHVIVFDYDGTLVYSNEVKAAAYRPLFPAVSAFDAFLAAALKKFPVGPRVAVIRDVLESGQLLAANSEAQTVQVERLLLQYDKEATEGAAICAIRPGSLDVLQVCSKHFPLYLLTTTPQDSIEIILESRKWACFFKEIHGWPTNKTERLKQIIIEECVRPTEVLMVGDHPSDIEAANAAGVSSILLKPGENLCTVLKRNKII